MERPIIFSGEMVRAILSGSKTQTRRRIKCGISDYRKIGVPEIGIKNHCPYGQPGDFLWVRESFMDITDHFPGNLHYRACATPADEEWLKSEGRKWKPSIHMPRKHSRILLEIVNIRVEQIQDISEDDAKAEGVQPMAQNSETLNNYLAMRTGLQYKPAFSFLWDKINEHRGFGWDANPWVWVVEFKKAKGE